MYLHTHALTHPYTRAAICLNMILLVPVIVGFLIGFSTNSKWLILAIGAVVFMVFQDVATYTIVDKVPPWSGVFGCAVLLCGLGNTMIFF